MNTKSKYLKVGAVFVVAVALIAAVGSITGSGSDANSSVLPEEVLDDGGVASSINQALGLDTDTAERLANSGEGRNAAALAPGGVTQSASDGVKGSAGSPPVVGGGTVSTNASAIDDRKIVQTATVKLQVKDVGASFGDVGNIATAAGGFVASSNFALQGEHQIANATIRVPAERYEEVLAGIRALGVKVEAEGSNASDVTEEYSDLSARIRNLEASELRLLELLGRAANVNEILQVQDRVNSTRTEIERLQGRINLLDKLSELATITVSMRPVAAVANTGGGGGVDLGEEVRQAWDDSLEFLGGIAAGVISVLVFSWWILVLAVPAALVLQRWSRTRPSPDGARYD